MGRLLALPATIGIAEKKFPGTNIPAVSSSGLNGKKFLKD
jgi:hypothetical protein